MPSYMFVCLTPTLTQLTLHCCAPLQEFKADVVLHFGMHGTVEWLPGAPLGNTGLSWSDVLLGWAAWRSIRFAVGWLVNWSTGADMA